MSNACTALDQARKNVGAREGSAQLRFSPNTLFKLRTATAEASSLIQLFQAHIEDWAKELGRAFTDEVREQRRKTWDQAQGCSQRHSSTFLAVSSEVVLGFRPHLSTLGCANSGRTKSHPKAISIFQQAHHLVDSHNKRDILEIRADFAPVQTASSLFGPCRKRIWLGRSNMHGRSAGARRTSWRRISKPRKPQGSRSLPIGRRRGRRRERTGHRGTSACPNLPLEGSCNGTHGCGRQRTTGVTSTTDGDTTRRTSWATQSAW